MPSKQVRCATCRKTLTANERRTKANRCGKCRYNSHGVRPTTGPRAQSDASATSFWMGHGQDGFTADAEKYFSEEGKKLRGFLWHRGFGPES